MPIRWGIIGCGDVAWRRVADAIRNDPNSQLTAACRRDAAKLRKFCDRFDVQRPYHTSDELIAAADIDAVYIATPVKDHAPQTIAAAAAGKHVLVEKPMAMSVAECTAMIDACRNANVQLGVAYYRRFYPLVQRMEALINDGAIGKPIAISAVTATPMKMQPGEDGYWRVLPAAGGGGALMDVGSHRINLFLRLAGNVVSVKAMCETIAANYNADDSAVLLLKFDGGMVGTLQCHFGPPFDPDEFAIIGDAGRLAARPLNGDTLIIETASGSHIEEHPPHDNFCSPLVADFVAAIAGGPSPMVSGEEGRATNDVMERAYQDAAN